MKTFFYYLNWALYDLNQFVWRSFILPNIKFKAFALLFFFVAFIPALLFTKISYEFLFFWAGLTTVILSFALITYWIYGEERGFRKSHSNIFIDNDTGIVMHSVSRATHEPYTLKESMKQGVWWTVYLFSMLILALTGTMIFGAQIVELANYVL